MIPPRVAAALAAALAASSAAAYVRTRGTGGVELAWREPVVAWHLNRDWQHTSPSCRATAAGDPTLDAVRASFAAWEQPCAGLRLLHAGTLPEIRVGALGSSENVVVFREGWCSTRADVRADPCYDDPDVDCGAIYNCYEDHTAADKSVVALTSVLYEPGTGRIFDADVEVNGWDGVVGGLVSETEPQHGWYFTCYGTSQPGPCTTYGQDGCHFIDLRNTVTHEVGHFIGLAHPCGVREGRPPCDSAPPGGGIAYDLRTMSPTTSVGDRVKIDLSADDVAGVCAIYPPAEGGCGCGGGGAGGALALLVAALALRRRPHPRSA